MKFININSPEKAIINNTFNSVSYIDMWISSIVEGYEKVDKVNQFGRREEYTKRYGKKEGEYRMWYSNGQLAFQYYYKDGDLEGEYKLWYENGQLWNRMLYKGGQPLTTENTLNNPCE